MGMLDSAEQTQPVSSSQLHFIFTPKLWNSQILHA